MVFITVCVCQLLLASAALSIPTSHEQRVTKSQAGQRKTTPPKVITNNATKNVTHAEYSKNWAGAVLIADSATYTSVTGTFTIPTLTAPSNGSASDDYYASAWVGIDGDTCDSAILQTGLDFTISGSSVSYDAWYEFYPDYSYYFSDTTFSTGDSITLTASVSSSTSGNITITNNSQGWTKTQTLTSSASLCQTNAEWIIEDFEADGSIVPLADFGTISFTNASAGTTSRDSVGPSGATIIDIQQDGEVLTSTSASDSSVTVEYTGS